MQARLSFSLIRASASSLLVSSSFVVSILIGLCVAVNVRGLDKCDGGRRSFVSFGGGILFEIHVSWRVRADHSGSSSRNGDNGWMLLMEGID